MLQRPIMKSSFFSMALLLSGVLSLLFLSDAFPADWRIYAGTDEGQFYYDEESITRPSPDVVYFRHKVIFSEKGVHHFAESLGKDYENLSYAISVREILCSEKKIRSLGVTYFSNTGDVLDQAIDSHSEWHLIEPSAMIEGLYQIICK